jgi:hypothetical protein
MREEKHLTRLIGNSFQMQVSGAKSALLSVLDRTN